MLGNKEVHNAIKNEIGKDFKLRNQLTEDNLLTATEEDAAPAEKIKNMTGKS